MQKRKICDAQERFNPEMESWRSRPDFQGLLPLPRLARAQLFPSPQSPPRIFFVATWYVLACRVNSLCSPQRTVIQARTPGYVFHVSVVFAACHAYLSSFYPICSRSLDGCIESECIEQLQG